MEKLWEYLLRRDEDHLFLFFSLLFLKAVRNRPDQSGHPLLISPWIAPWSVLVYVNDLFLFFIVKLKKKAQNEKIKTI